MPNAAVAGHGLLKRAIAVWLVLIAVEFIHGILRAIFLVPVVGGFRSRQIGVFIGSALILVVAYLSVGWLRAPDTKSLLLVGLLWLVLTVAFEFGFGHFISGARGRAWEKTTTCRRAACFHSEWSCLRCRRWLRDGCGAQTQEAARERTGSSSDTTISSKAASPIMTT